MTAMHRRTLCGLLLLVPAALSAQEGTIAYTHSVRTEIPEGIRERVQARGGRPEEMFPTERVSEVVLLFNGAESLMKPVPPEEGAGRPGEGPPGMRDRRGGMAARMRLSSASRRQRERIVEAYVRYDEGTIVEAREFLGRTFLIADDRPAFRWRITGEQAEFLGYVVQKAVAQQDSSTVEAWFTPQIPLPGGPAIYGGLPGMILVVSVDGGAVQYSATAISLSAVADGVIVRPTGGESLSRDAYEEIVAEKLEELRTVGGGGR